MNHLLLPQQQWRLQLPPNLPKPPPSISLLQTPRNFLELKQLHAHLIISGLLRPPYAANLLKSSLSISQIDYALSVFNSIPSPDAFTYNTMIRALAISDFSTDSLLLFVDLLNSGTPPDNHSFTFVLKACSNLKAVCEGKQVHGRVIKAGICADTFVHSSLVHMYCCGGEMESAERIVSEFGEEEEDTSVTVKNCVVSGWMRWGCVGRARQVFDEMAERDAASWSAMVSGYARNGMYLEAVELYGALWSDGGYDLPNESALVSALSACAHLGALDRGKWIHSHITKTGMNITTTLGTALVEMYAKCGEIQTAHQVFDEIPRRDVVAWGAIISGFASHGYVSSCTKLFSLMIADKIRPNAVIFVSLLSACSHGGCVELGLGFFEQMVCDFHITPSIEHYGCMVDLLSRGGLLTEAEEFILSMPEKPNAIIWGSFLSGCRMYNDTRRGDWALGRLKELEPNSGDRYKLAGLMYANAGEQKGAVEMRKFIEENELETTMGKSFIEVEGEVHEFMVGDLNHDRKEEIYKIYENGY